MDKVVATLMLLPAMIITGAVLLLLSSLIMAFPVMWCYNAVGPVTFSFPELGYWQAVALYLFVGFLGLRTEAKTSSSE